MGQAASKQEAFWEACGFGHTARVKNFIAQGIDVNWVSYTHNSCAIHVASQGKPEIVKMLLDADCDVNAKDERSCIALHHAAMKGHADICKMLIQAGSQVNAQDKNFWTPVINAAYFCQPECVELLLKHKCDVLLQNKDDRSALHEACRSQNKDEEGLGRIAKVLIEAGSDINSKSSDVGEADFTPLMFTAYHGHTAIARELIKAGCDINSQGTNGWTALHWAADRGQVAMVKILLEACIDPFLLGRRGESALDRAYLSEIRKLLQQAVDEARGDPDSPSHSQASAQLKALNSSITAKSVQNQALLAMVNQTEVGRRSPVSTHDGSESERSLPATPEMAHREKSEVEPLEKHLEKNIDGVMLAPTADSEDLDDSFDSDVHRVTDTGRRDVGVCVQSHEIIKETNYVKKSKPQKPQPVLEEESVNSQISNNKCDFGMTVHSSQIVEETHYKKKIKASPERDTSDSKIDIVEEEEEEVGSACNSPEKISSSSHKLDEYDIDDILDIGDFNDGLKDIPDIDESL